MSIIAQKTRKKTSSFKTLAEKLQFEEILMVQTHVKKQMAQMKLLSTGRFYSPRLGRKNQCQAKSNKMSTNK